MLLPFFGLFHPAVGNAHSNASCRAWNGNFIEFKRSSSQEHTQLFGDIYDILQNE